MIDFHTHTFWSDGELIPSEHIRHAKMKGYQAIAITDHADSSNIDTICREAVYFAKRMREMQDEITVLSGLELTHILPVEIAELTQYARAQGIEMVLVHGETIVEPVREGTNRAAVEACVDILAHPGLIDEGTVELAAKNGVYLEITSRKGHSLTNGLVAMMARKWNASLVVDTDSHTYSDMITDAMALKVLKGCGLGADEIERVFRNSQTILNKKLNT